MASALCLITPPNYLKTKTEPGNGIDGPTKPTHIRVNYVFQGLLPPKYRSAIPKATNGNNPKTKPDSIICAECDGNGAVQCSQCKGSGINSVDLFNGQFKAGDTCWLCGGKKEMLCGNCNGAGFIGGFLSTYDQ